MISRDLSIHRALRARQRGFLLNPFRFGGGGGSGVPSIRSQQAGAFSTLSSHSIAMPPTVVPGDRILVAIGLEFSRTVTINTEVSGFDWVVHENASYSDAQTWVASKVATSTNALSISLNAASGVVAAAFSVESGGVVRSISQAFDFPGVDIANAPALTGLPSDASAVCFVVFSGGGSVTTSSAPAGYSLIAQRADGGQIFAATKTLSGTTEDPAPWAPGGNTRQVISTVVLTNS